MAWSNNTPEMNTQTSPSARYSQVKPAILEVGRTGELGRSSPRQPSDRTVHGDGPSPSTLQGKHGKSLALASCSRPSSSPASASRCPAAKMPSCTRRRPPVPLTGSRTPPAFTAFNRAYGEARDAGAVFVCVARRHHWTVKTDTQHRGARSRCQRVARSSREITVLSTQVTGPLRVQRNLRQGPGREPRHGRWPAPVRGLLGRRGGPSPPAGGRGCAPRRGEHW